MKIGKLVFFAVISLLFSACFTIGDGLVLIKGRIVSEGGRPVEDCEFAMFREGEREYSDEEGPRYVTDVASEFEAGFMISPNNGKYYFKISCPHYKDRYRSKVFEFNGGTYAYEPLDLGAIVINQ